MKKLMLLFTLLIVSAVGSLGQGTWHGWSSNNQQTCTSYPSACWTPWASGTASCDAPNLGIDGFRILGGSTRILSQCLGGYATAQISNSLPYSYELKWLDEMYTRYGGLAYQYGAFSDCTYPTSENGDYAANNDDFYDDNRSNFGCTLS